MTSTKKFFQVIDSTNLAFLIHYDSFIELFCFTINFHHHFILAVEVVVEVVSEKWQPTDPQLRRSQMRAQSY